MPAHPTPRRSSTDETPGGPAVRHHRAPVTLVVLLALLVVTMSSAPAGGSRLTAPAPDPRVEPLTVTSPGDPALRLLRRAPVAPSDGSSGLVPGLGPGPVDDVVVRPGERRQVWRGTGAALSDGAVRVLAGRPDLAARLVGPDHEYGARLAWVRLPLTATDLSTSLWGWRWDGRRARPSPQARAALDVLTGQLLVRNPGLRVVATPWTALPRFKAPRTWNGGSLRGDAVGEYADMLVAQARWLVANDVPLRAMTLANEPGHTADYPTMRVSDAQLRRLAAAVGPRLGRLGVQLWGLDHNWSDRGRLDGGTADLDAVAFHCYSGTPDDARGLGLPWLVSECTGTTDGAVGTFAYDARMLVEWSTARGSTGLFFWNLALAPGWRGSFGGCHTCRGLLTVGASATRNGPEFATLAHLARAAPPGSRVVATSAPGDVSVVAFRAGRRVGVFGFNAAARTRRLRLVVPGAGPAPVFRVGPHEMFSWSTSL